MAFGLKRKELMEWKEKVKKGEIAFLTHFWLDSRFPDCDTVTKVGCANLDNLIEWGNYYQLNPKWIHRDKKYPHYDLVGEWQRKILIEEKQWDQLKRFNISD